MIIKYLFMPAIVVTLLVFSIPAYATGHEHGGRESPTAIKIEKEEALSTNLIELNKKVIEMLECTKSSDSVLEIQGYSFENLIGFCINFIDPNILRKVLNNVEFKNFMKRNNLRFSLELNCDGQ